MKYLIEFYPPVDVKNNFEKSPDLQKKAEEAIGLMKPLAAWFTTVLKGLEAQRKSKAANVHRRT